MLFSWENSLEIYGHFPVRKPLVTRAYLWSMEFDLPTFSGDFPHRSPNVWKVPSHDITWLVVWNMAFIFHHILGMS